MFKFLNIKTLLSIERYISIAKPAWRRVLFLPKQAVISSVICILALGIINFNVLFKHGYDIYVNGTYDHTVCWIQANIPETNWIKTWNQVHTILYSYIPFVLLVIANALLVHHMARSKSKARSRKRTSNQRSMNITILVLTVLFVVFTGISTVVTIF